MPHSASVWRGAGPRFAGRVGIDSTDARNRARFTMADDRDTVRLFVCGDVMLGRGIDQIMPQACDPVLHEPWVDDARTYLRIAEATNGEIPAPVDPGYVWGDALARLRDFAPDLRVINLETAVTCNDEPWPGKDIHYRMHPDNVGVLRAAGIDACALANNHVLDWGHAGLTETLESLQSANIATAGAGESLAAARTPAVLEPDSGGRVILLSFGSGSSGIPRDWAAREDGSGVWRIDEGDRDTIDAVARQIGAVRQDGDIVIASIHWGGNWGYGIPTVQRRFAHALIDVAGVDIVHGHSAHHPKGIEVHRGRLVLYGCGDLINDYEGIGGHGGFRPELTLLYFPTLEPGTGRLLDLALRPMHIRRFQLTDATEEEAAWLLQRMNRECDRLDTRLNEEPDGTFRLQWQA